MNLSDMASYVATKVRQTDAASLGRAKLFLKQRYEMIWNEALWRASVYRHDFTFYSDPGISPQPPFGNYWSNKGTDAAHGGVQMLPSMVDRVLALRRADAGVRVEQAETLFRCALDEFEEAGVAQKFLILPPAVLDFQRDTEDDVASAGVRATNAAGDAGVEMVVRYLDFDGEKQEETLTLDGGGIVIMAGSPQLILSVTKPATTADVLFDSDGDSLFTIPAAATAATRYARIRLLPQPNQETDFKCLVKKKPAALDNDEDEPELAGVENALMSFAHGDLLQHARQYGKAQGLAQEALALLEQFKRMEVVQQATRCQVTPDVEEMSGDWENSKAWYA